MAWRIEFDAGALRDLRRVDRQVARRITLFLRERIGVQEDPRRFGAALKRAGAAESVPLWRYRVVDWRIVVHIEDDTLRVLIVRIAHRREAYRGL